MLTVTGPERRDRKHEQCRQQRRRGQLADVGSGPRAGRAGPLLLVLEDILHPRRRCSCRHAVAVPADRRHVHGGVQRFQRRDIHCGHLAAARRVLPPRLLGGDHRADSARHRGDRLCRHRSSLSGLYLPGGYPAFHPAVLCHAPLGPAVRGHAGRGRVIRRSM